MQFSSLFKQQKNDFRVSNCAARFGKRNFSSYRPCIYVVRDNITFSQVYVILFRRGSGLVGDGLKVGSGKLRWSFSAGYQVRGSDNPWSGRIESRSSGPGMGSSQEGSDCPWMSGVRLTSYQLQ